MGSIASLLPLVLFLVLLSVLPTRSHCTLLSTILVSRHGTRAPNVVTVKLCPADANNLARYADLDISLEGVTGRGMHQLYQLGEYSKQRYVDTGFLRRYYSNEEMYIRAVGEDRTLQSAVAWGHALYPAGHAPIGYRKDVPSPLPVYTLPDELDVLLENRKAGCHQRLKADVEHWDDTAGRKQRSAFAPLLSRLDALCRVNLSAAIEHSGDNYGDAVKDITDSWTFDFIEHFPPVPGLTLEALLQFRTYAVQQLIGRILGTDEQVTYLNGDLPDAMLDAFQAVVDHHSNHSRHHTPRPLKFIAYHGHREMMYALAVFFDIRYNITYPALPIGAIPPATSLFFELHHSDDSYVVQAVLWTPCDSDDFADADKLVTPDVTDMFNFTTHGSNATLARPPAHGSASPGLPNASSGRRPSLSQPSSSFHHSWTEKECGARPIAISACPHGVCSIEQFRAVVRKQIERTGEWRDLCKYNDETGKEEWDNTPRDPTKVAGAGKTHPGHSRGSSTHTASSSHTDGNSHHHHSSDTRGEEGEGEEGGSGSAAWSWSSGWPLLALCLAGAVALGALLYWWCIMRGAPDRAEYRPVPDR